MTVYYYCMYLCVNTAPPVRNRGPGTMGYIAQRGGGSGKENKVRGPRCGQCEEKGAQVVRTHLIISDI